MAEFFNVPDFETQWPELAQFLRRLYPGKPLADVNLEEVATHLDVAAMDPARSWLGDLDPAKLIRALNAFIVKRLSVPQVGLDDICPLYDRLVDRAVEERAAVLSLNYDLLFDAPLSMKAKRGGRDESFWRESQWFFIDQYEDHPQAIVRTSDAFGGFFVKLHGGLNWWRCTNAECPRYQTILVHQYGWSPSGIMHEGQICKICGAAFGRVIVPPTMKGVFGQVRRLGALWWLGFDALRRADRVVAIGVSFAETDYLLRWLVRQSRLMRDHPLDELVIANANAPHVKITEQLFLPRATQTHASFEAFLGP